jgi:hypothetical protein
MGRTFLWNEEKDSQLRATRGLSFSMVVEAIEKDGLIVDQVCVVPYVTDGDVTFLKTIYPSRKYQKIYGGENG